MRILILLLLVTGCTDYIAVEIAACHYGYQEAMVKADKFTLDTNRESREFCTKEMKRILL